jgi:hypothetical protein
VQLNGKSGIHDGGPNLEVLLSQFQCLRFYVIAPSEYLVATVSVSVA